MLSPGDGEMEENRKFENDYYLPFKAEVKVIFNEKNSDLISSMRKIK